MTKNKASKRQSNIIAIGLIIILLLSIILIPIFTTGTQFASAVSNTDDNYNAANTYDAVIETRTETIDGKIFSY